jgi:hypothetical protein
MTDWRRFVNPLGAPINKEPVKLEKQLNTPNDSPGPRVPQVPAVALADIDDLQTLIVFSQEYNRSRIARARRCRSLRYRGGAAW